MTIQKALRKEFKSLIFITLIYFAMVFSLTISPDYKIAANAKLFLAYSIPALVGLTSFLSIPYIKKAYTYQLFIVFLNDISNVVMIFSLYAYLEISSLDAISYLKLGVILILLILWAANSTFIARQQFINVEAQNIISGKLNWIEATWDLRKETHWKKQTNIKINNYLFIVLFILFSVLFYLIGNSIEKKYGIPFEEFFILVICFAAIFDSGRNLNLLFQLKRWEKELGKPIMLTIDE